MPTIVKGSDYMQAVTYTGNGGTNAITGLSFQPDFVWIKGRSGATDHALYDAVRGATKDLVSNSTAAETTQSTGLVSFDSNGFTLGALSKVNTSGATYVAWCWKAGSSTVTNTSGTISSQVRANPTAGVSVVTWTGTAANGTIGHGLGVAPKMIICKSRGDAASWGVWHTSLTSYTYYLKLNTTDAQATAATTLQAAPSATLISLGSSNIFNSNQPMVMYAFSEIAGFSKFGSYTGNGSADGPFVYCGFRPKYVMVKESSGTNAASAEWVIKDTSRNNYNTANLSLRANSATAEDSGDQIDILSNGFKLRASGFYVNESNGTYIYMAFAENPFRNALAR